MVLFRAASGDCFNVSLRRQATKISFRCNKPGTVFLKKSQGQYMTRYYPSTDASKCALHFTLWPTHCDRTPASYTPPIPPFAHSLLPQTCDVTTCTTPSMLTSGRNIIKLLCAVSIVAGVLWFGLPGTGKSSRTSLLSVKDSDHDEPSILGNLTTGNARHSL